MSIVEILSSVDSIAKAIAKKNQELETLKQQLAHELSIVNTYISNHLDSEATNTDYKTILHQLEPTVECPNCKHTIWNNQDPRCPFVLVPKSKLSQPASSPETELRKLSINSNVPLEDNRQSEREKPTSLSPTTTSLSPTKSSPPPSSTVPNAKAKLRNPKVSLKSKSKLCSYCKQQGHTRAKCMLRLTTPVKEE